MREQILVDLNNAVTWNNQLKAYSLTLPKNLLDGAANAFNESIPKMINQILNLLNSVSGHERFEQINNIDEAIVLFSNEVDELDAAFHLVPENQNIIGFAGGGYLNAQRLLDDMKFWLNAHCDTINMMLTAGKMAAGH